MLRLTIADCGDIIGIRVCKNCRQAEGHTKSGRTGMTRKNAFLNAWTGEQVSSFERLLTVLFQSKMPDSQMSLNEDTNLECVLLFNV